MEPTNQVTNGKSYAAAVVAPKRAVTCQTELTWLAGGKPTAATQVPNANLTNKATNKQTQATMMQTPVSGSSPLVVSITGVSGSSWPGPQLSTEK